MEHRGARRNAHMKEHGMQQMMLTRSGNDKRHVKGNRLSLQIPTRKLLTMPAVESRIV